MKLHVFVLFLCALGPVAPLSLSPRNPKLDVDDLKEFTLLGFVPGQTEFALIEQTMGKAKHFYARRGIGKRPPMICYVASTPDHTRVTFTKDEESDDLHDLQVTAGSEKVGWEASCAISNKISANIATSAGVGLGLSRAAVIAHFGPTKNRTERGGLVYRSSRVTTSSEIKKLCGTDPICSPSDTSFDGDIYLDFRNGGLVSLIVSRGIRT